MAEGIPVDNQNFVHLVSCTQLLARELRKCRRLVYAMPVDMTEYYGERAEYCGDGAKFCSEGAECCGEGSEHYGEGAEYCSDGAE